MPAFRIALPIVVLGAMLLPSSGASAWTPSPERIVYISRADGDQDVYTMNPDGTGRSGPLTKNSISDCDPVFSPDGSQIAWVSSTAEDISELWIMDTNGSNPRQITHGPDPDYVRGPTWSPDGNTIVFQRGMAHGTPAEDHDLHMVRRANGLWGTEETFVDTAAWEYSPAFANDGRVAYVSGVPRSDPYQADIWIRDAAGSTAPLRTTPGPEGAPSWNFDGTRLAYPRPYGLYMYSTATGQETELVARTSGMPDWASNRNELIYHYNQSNTDLFRLDMRTSRWRTTNITKGSKAVDADGDW